MNILRGISLTHSSVSFQYLIKKLNMTQDAINVICESKGWKVQGECYLPVKELLKEEEIGEKGEKCLIRLERLVDISMALQL